jgi:hypothetical protein
MQPPTTAKSGDTSVRFALVRRRAAVSQRSSSTAILPGEQHQGPPVGIPMLSRIFLAIFANCGPISSCIRLGGSR